MTGTSAVKTIDAGANTGKTSLVLGAANQTVTLGSGNDTIDIGGNMTWADKIQGGAGTDTIKITTAGTINGPATATDTSAEFLQSGGFEVIDVASTNDAATLNLSKISGVETAKVGAHVRTITVAGNAANDGNNTISGTLNGVAITTTASVDHTGNVAADNIAGAAAIAATLNALTGVTAVSDGVSAVTVTKTSVVFLSQR